MANKIITDDILKKATEGVIQTIADNIFEFESYNDTEIAELFSLTPEEAQNLTELINDEVISKYKLWSSKKVSDELLNAQNECNDYTDDRLSGISSISLNYCEELPDVAESNCIYILKSTDNNPDTLNLYSDEVWTSIGDFNISLDEYYKKLEIDTKLDLKADKTEILAQDDVITDTSLATTSNVLSATTTLNELDKKANDDEVVKKTDITTTIDSTSTDTQVPSAKTIWNNLSSGMVRAVLSASANEDILAYADNITPKSNCEVYIVRFNTCQNAPSGVVDCFCLIRKISNVNWIGITLWDIRTENVYEIRKTAGTWGKWKKLCTTSVEDVDKVMITTQNLTEGIVSYFVKNGICYVSISRITPSVNGGSTIITANTLPPPDAKGNNHYTIGTTSGVIGLFVINNDGSAVFYGQNTVSYFGQFSYPVRES